MFTDLILPSIFNYGTNSIPMSSDYQRVKNRYNLTSMYCIVIELMIHDLDSMLKSVLEQQQFYPA